MIRPPTSSRASRKHKLRGLVAAALFVLSGTLAFAAEPSPSPTATPNPATTWHLLVEPKFMQPDYATPIEGSKETVLTPGLIKDGEVTHLTKADVARLKLDLDSVQRVARAAAGAEVANFKPDYVRDDHGVLLYAVITTDSPATASAVLSPEFAKMFADTLGPDLLVALPNRYRIYVYPALASEFQGTADLVRRDFEISPYPVSKEVFRLTPKGLQAIGSFDPNN